MIFGTNRFHNFTNVFIFFRHKLSGLRNKLLFKIIIFYDVDDSDNDGRVKEVNGLNGPLWEPLADLPSVACRMRSH